MFDSKLGLGLRKRIEMKFLSLEKLSSHLVKSKVKINELVLHSREVHYSQILDTSCLL